MRTVGLLAVTFGALAARPAPQESHWRAQWIGYSSGPSEGNIWLAFRKQVDLPATPQSAFARIAASDKYWLWVNGELVVFEGQLKRGPTPRDTYYDSLDLTPFLEEGPNAIAVAVWFWGRDGLSHRTTGQAGLLFDADVDGRPITSGDGWRVRSLPAYTSTQEPHPNWRLAEQNIRYDAREAISGWERRSFDDGTWPRATELGQPPIPPWNELVPRPIPMWRNGGLHDYAMVSGLPTGAEGGEVVARLPHNMQVTPYLRVDAAPGLVIGIRTDTYNTSGTTSVRAEYVTRAGVQEYESYGWMNGHAVRYSIPPGVEVLELGYRETGYDADFAGRFDTDDPDLNVLWTKARRTLYVNMRDTHMDCPDRERAQWWGDVVNQLGQVLYSLDAERGPLLARKGIHELAAWRRSNLTLTSPIPYGRNMNPPELPMQILAAVGWYGFWTYYLYTGDAQTIVDVYPAVREYLGLWSMSADGLVILRDGGWAWADWGEHVDERVLQNAWYYLALKAAVRMADLADAQQDVAAYRQRMESIAAAFYRIFWRGDHFRSPEHEGETDDRANAMAVVAGLARAEDFQALRQVLRRKLHASPYMEKYVLEALFLMDAPGEAITRMKRRYGPQIDSWVTTLWENWDLGDWGYNHGWAGGPLTVLSQYVAGVAPTTPGYGDYQVFPNLGPLRRVDAVVPTPQGHIRLNLQKNDTSFLMTLTTPLAADGTVGIPLDRLTLQRLTVNGVVLWQDGAPTGTTSNVEILSLDERRVKLSVPPGRWTFEATGARTPLLEPGETFNLSENPVRSGRVVFNFLQAPDRAGVYALDGRRVVDLIPRMTETDQIVWDLTNANGGRIAPGIYLVVARVGDAVIRKKLIVSNP